jgi:UDP-N-acetylmuramyl pentapeptide phosphotransferase/UDP-N-acetylglucosamine-1-phosphate transferase
VFSCACVSTFSEASSASVVFDYWISAVFLALIFLLQSLITVGWIDDFMMIVYRMMKKRALPDILEIGD